MAEIRVQILYDEASPDGGKMSDRIIRDISQILGPEAIWEKYGEGWRATN